MNYDSEINVLKQRNLDIERDIDQLRLTVKHQQQEINNLRYQLDMLVAARKR